MRIKITKSKNKEHYSIITDVVINEKRTTRVYENIGNKEKLIEKAGSKDPITWLKNYVNELNNKVKNSKAK